MSTETPPTPAFDPVQAATSPRQRSDDDGDVSNTASPSRTAPAPAAAAVPAAPPARPVSPPNQMTDPVSALQAMFPSMDRTIITEVLAAHGGNPDAASMALLELSDGSPATATTAAGTGGAGSHTANAQMLADEAYARELMAQMEREHMSEYGRPLGSAPHATRGDQQQQGIDYSRLNYTPRQQGQHVPSSGRGGAGSRTGLDQMVGQQQGQDVQQGDGRPKYQDELDQLTVQLEKFADTGKKTFNSLLSKAKDKYSEMQTQRTLQGAQYQDQQGHPRSSASSSGSGSVTGATYTQPTTIAGFTIPSIPAPWQGGFAGFGGAASTNSGNGNREGSFRPASPRDNLRSGAASSNRKESVMRDYSQSPTSPQTPTSGAMYSRDDLDDDAPPIQISRSPNSTPSQPIRASSSTAAPALSSSPATAAPGLSTSPVPTRSAFGSSPAKVHMLPRQTINLMEEDMGAKDRDTASRSASPAVFGARATSPSAGTAPGGATAPGATAAAKTPAKRDADDSDNESVEYVRNPFNNDDD